LVAFHVKFNEDFDGLEAGHIAKDILKVRDGRWTYQDRHTQLKRDDIIYYWIHVVYQGLGYNSIDHSYQVISKSCINIYIFLFVFNYIKIIYFFLILLSFIYDLIYFISRKNDYLLATVIRLFAIF